MIRALIIRLLKGWKLTFGRRPSGQRLGVLLLKLVPGSLSCAEFEAFVHDYHEDLVPGDVRDRFEEHMALCPRCRVHFDAYVRTVALGKRVCEDEDQLPDDLPEELVGAILLAREEEPDL